MLRLSTLAGAVPIVVSCLLHVGLVGGALALGQVWSPREPIILEAELVTPDPPAPVEPPRPEPPRPTPPKPKAPLPPAPTVLPRPLEPPPKPEVAPPPPEPVPPPPARADASPAPPAPVEPGRTAQRTTSAAPAVSLPSSGDTGPAEPAAPATPPPGPATAKVAPDAPTKLAHPRGGYQVRPSYPSSARRIGAEGTTLLRVYVAADGQVTDVVVDQSAGHPDLDRAAVDAVRRWRFEAGRRGAEAIGMWVRLPVQFVLR